MEWRDEGIVLGTRKHGETSVIAEMMTRLHGRHSGLVRGGRSRRMQPILQPGNRVDLVWRARLDEHLGFYAVEPVELRSGALIDSAAALYGVQLAASHLRLLPERDPHEGLYVTLGHILDHLDTPLHAAELLVRLELRVIEELGFGLDLGACAATGARADLAYVSPKSGRAVSRAAGAPWADRLLALPAFLAPGSGLRADREAIDAAFAMTGYFLSRHVLEPRGIDMPEARAGFLAAVRRHASTADGEHAA